MNTMIRTIGSNTSYRSNTIVTTYARKTSYRMNTMLRTIGMNTSYKSNTIVTTYARNT